MKIVMIAAAAAGLVPSMMIASVPAQAYTAYQHWMQGRGVEVSSKARPSGLLEELGIIEPQPSESYRARPPGSYRTAPPPRSEYRGDPDD